MKNEMDGNEIIENFGELPAEEQARLVARQEANEWAAIERMREENLKLEEELRRLEAMADEQKRIADAMEQLVEQSRHNRLERDSLLSNRDQHC